MNVLICDDKRDEADKLSGLLEDSGFHVKTAVFHDPAAALACVRSGKVIDVCVLDIVMPDMSGIELAGQLRGIGFGGEIVFLSASGDFGPASYRVKAFDYLLKPPTPDAVRDVLRRIEDTRRKADTEGFMVNTKSFTGLVLFRDIEYAEVSQHKVYFKRTDGTKIEMNATFADIAPQLLVDKRFAQCHNSYIVNMAEIASINWREAILRSGAVIPVSRSFPDAKWKYVDWGLERVKK